MPEDLAEDIGNSYDELAKMTGQNEPYVAVRSSATAEDLPDDADNQRHHHRHRECGDQAVHRLFNAGK